MNPENNQVVPGQSITPNTETAVEPLLTEDSTPPLVTGVQLPEAGLTDMSSGQEPAPLPDATSFQPAVSSQSEQPLPITQVPPIEPQPVVAQPPTSLPNPELPTAATPVAAFIQTPEHKHMPKSLLALLIIIVLLLIGGGAVLASKMFSNAISNRNQAATPVTASEEKQSTTAPTLAEVNTIFDLSATCDSPTAFDAAAFGGPAPHEIVLFDQSVNSGSYITSSVTPKDTTWLVDNKTPQMAQLIGCLKRSTETAGPKCQLKDSKGNAIDFQAYSVNYELKVYEAKTGKVVGGGNVASKPATCPSFAAIDKSNPKYYAPAMTDQALALIQPLVTK